MNGKLQWVFYDTNVLESPRGITTDNNNNIYVVDGGSDNVVVLSPDEENCKVLVSDHDGIYLPCGIHCDRASNQLLLTKTGGDTGLLYDISTTRT
jgi:DNA-binding beta-propeller fold protein YncE